MGELPIERELRRRVEALGPTVRALLLTILRLPEDRRAARIGELWADGRTRSLAELLIDVEVDDRVRGIVQGELRRRSGSGGRYQGTVHDR